MGVALTGLSAAELAALPERARDDIRVRATADMTEAGADMVIDSIADPPAAIATLEQRMARGERPLAG